MSDGIRILQWHQQFDALEWMKMKQLDAVDTILRQTATRALADRIMRDSCLERRVAQPAPDDPWHGTRVTVTWAIGIADRSLAGDLAHQLERARAEGMRAAAEIVAAASRRREGREGFCAPVIASSLAEAAHAIERKAKDVEEALRPRNAPETR